MVLFVGLNQRKEPKMRLNPFLIALIFSFFTFQSAANCFGTERFKTCYDDSGNTYNVQNFGNSTFVQGTNAQGESWMQDTYRTGSMSQTYGTAPDILEPTMWVALNRIDALDEIVGRTFESNK